MVFFWKGFVAIESGSFAFEMQYSHGVQICIMRTGTLFDLTCYVWNYYVLETMLWPINLIMFEFERCIRIFAHVFGGSSIMPPFLLCCFYVDLCCIFLFFCCIHYAAKCGS